MEPGRRCFVLPCVFGPPWKPQRFTTPWKPRPFVVPVIFTFSPGVKIVTSILSPTLCTGISAFAFPGSSSRMLRMMRGAASSPAFLAWPSSAVLARFPFGVRSPFAFARRVRCVPVPSCSALSRLVLVTASTVLGSASITVHGICCPASLNSWVMPSFLPMMPIMDSSAESLEPELQLDCGPGGHADRVLCPGPALVLR